MNLLYVLIEVSSENLIDVFLHTKEERGTHIIFEANGNELAVSGICKTINLGDDEVVLLSNPLTLQHKQKRIT
jgi:hypothetical protein